MRVSELTETEANRHTEESTASVSADDSMFVFKYLYVISFRTKKLNHENDNVDRKRNSELCTKIGRKLAI